MKLFRLLLRTNSRIVMIGMVVSVLSGASNAALIALIHHVWGAGEFTRPLWMVVFSGLLLLAIASGLAAQITILNLSLKAMAELRLELSARILATPLHQLERLGGGRILATLADDVSAISRTLPIFPKLMIDVSMVLLGVAYLTTLSWVAVLTVAGFIFLGYLVYKPLTRKSLIHMARGREVYDHVYEQIRALWDGMKQLKLSERRRQSFLTEDMKPILWDYWVKNKVARGLTILAENLTRLLFFMLLGVLLFVVPRIIGTDSQILSGFLMMALFLYRPFGTIMNAIPDVARAAIAFQKVEALGISLVDGTAVPERVDAPRQSPDWRSLELRGVKYTYYKESEDRPFTCGPVDLSFAPGELVFVIGGNGSGKTTLAKILTSLYVPEEGQILLDDVAVNDGNREEYRRLFSVVFPDFHIFTRVLGSPGEDVDQEALPFLERLELQHKVQVKDGLLTTTNLSQGQRKRLALLAAYLEDRPFYVFDEWASDQDPRFKKIFYTELLPELKARGKTVIAITHDDRYLYVADRCIKLEEGQLLEQATYEAAPEP